MTSGEITAIVIVVIIVLAAFAYWNCWLNNILPDKLKKTNCGKSGFVGAYGRTPEMQHCLAYPDPRGKKHWSTFNRCTWV